jgi:hypothetical protein
MDDAAIVVRSYKVRRPMRGSGTSLCVSVAGRPKELSRRSLIWVIVRENQLAFIVDAFHATGGRFEIFAAQTS